MPFALNVTTDGFPAAQLPALSHLETLYRTNWRFAFGFASCVALTPDERTRGPALHALGVA